MKSPPLFPPFFVSTRLMDSHVAQRLRGISALLEALDDIMQEPVAERTVSRTTVGPFTVSTVYARDVKCYETAILDKNGAHPVERYPTRDDAECGHEKWCMLAPTLTEVTEIGHPLLGGVNKIVVLLPRRA